MKSFLLPLVAVTVLSPYLDSWAGEREELPAAIGIFSKGIEIQTDSHPEAISAENHYKWPEIECVAPLAIVKDGNWAWVGNACMLPKDIPEQIRELEGRNFYTLEKEPKRIRSGAAVTVYHLVDEYVAALKSGDVEKQRLPEERKIMVMTPAEGAQYQLATTCEDASAVTARTDVTKTVENLQPEIEKHILAVEKQIAESKYFNRFTKYFNAERRGATVVKAATQYTLRTGGLLLFLAAEKPYFRESETGIAKEEEPKGLFFGIFLRDDDAKVEEWRLAWHSVTPCMSEGAPCRHYGLLNVTDVNQDRSPELMLGFHTYEGIGWTVLRFDNKMLIPIGELWESL